MWALLLHNQELLNKDSKMDITKELAEKVLQVVDQGLIAGLGQPVPGQMCVEAAVCYAMGLPHSDKPTCVDQYLSHLKIQLNDSRIWTSNKARAKGLRRLAIVQLGTKDCLDIHIFLDLVLEHVIKNMVPHAVSDEFFTKMGFSKALCEYFDLVDTEPFTKGVDGIGDSLSYVSLSESAITSVIQSLGAAIKVEHPLVKIEYLLSPVLSLVHYNRTINYIGSLLDIANSREKLLSEFCEAVVQILVKMGTPGSKFLYLTE